LSTPASVEDLEKAQLADPKTKKNKCSIDEASHSHGKNDPSDIHTAAKKIKKAKRRLELTNPDEQD